MLKATKNINKKILQNILKLKRGWETPNFSLMLVFTLKRRVFEWIGVRKGLYLYASFHLGYNWVLGLFYWFSLKNKHTCNFLSESCTWAHIVANLVPSGTTMHLGYITHENVKFWHTSNKMFYAMFQHQTQITDVECNI